MISTFSPFESVYMFHIRSRLEKLINELTREEKMKLIYFDLKLIKNTQKMVKHIEEIYDFSLSNEPTTEWWWHLDEVANGNITFILIPQNIDLKRT